MVSLGCDPSRNANNCPFTEYALRPRSILPIWSAFSQRDSFDFSHFSSFNTPGQWAPQCQRKRTYYFNHQRKLTTPFPFQPFEGTATHPTFEQHIFGHIKVFPLRDPQTISPSSQVTALEHMLDYKFEVQPGPILREQK